MKLKKGNGGKKKTTVRTRSQQEAYNRTPMQEKARNQAEERRRWEKDEQMWKKNPARVFNVPEELAKMSLKELRAMESRNTYAKNSKLGVESAPHNVGISMEQIKDNERKIAKAFKIKGVVE